MSENPYAPPTDDGAIEIADKTSRPLALACGLAALACSGLLTFIMRANSTLGFWPTAGLVAAVAVTTFLFVFKRTNTARIQFVGAFAGAAVGLLSAGIDTIVIWIRDGAPQKSSENLDLLLVIFVTSAIAGLCGAIGASMGNNEKFRDAQASD